LSGKGHRRVPVTADDAWARLVVSSAFRRRGRNYGGVGRRTTGAFDL